MKNLICSSLVAVATIASVAFASGMPFPVAENNKVFLQEKDSPYVLEQSVVVGATDTLVIEPGVTVLMGEFAKLMIQGSVKIAGTNDKPVVFSGADSVANWNGFHIMSSAQPFEIKNLTVERMHSAIRFSVLAVLSRTSISSITIMASGSMKAPM